MLTIIVTAVTYLGAAALFAGILARERRDARRQANPTTPPTSQEG